MASYDNSLIDAGFREGGFCVGASDFCTKWGPRDLNLFLVAWVHLTKQQCLKARMLVREVLFKVPCFLIKKEGKFRG